MATQETTYQELIRKYDVPTPRYTSYPTVPYWEEESFRPNEWPFLVEEAFDRSNAGSGISIYIHLPYCESLCTFCGCNKRITKNHSVEAPYIEAVLTEWKHYLALFNEIPVIRELHLGGGTPTFFSPQNLERLVKGILQDAQVAEDHEFGLEAHPNVTTKEHLRVLSELGFDRLSLGIQDFDPYVQKMINRVQSYETVAKVTEEAREHGFSSINYDLVYGLPFQKKEAVIDTVEKVRELKPERIALYSYAHVPWKSPGQRRYSEDDLPSSNYKRELYELGRNLLAETGYYEIGLDHFALPGDDLYDALLSKTIHRNFMGYTPRHTQLVVGLGASAISDTWTAFMQNDKVVEDYLARVEKEFPIFRGHQLTAEDQVLRKHILNLMCNLRTSWDNEHALHPSLQEGLERMKEFEKDGLIMMYPASVEVTQLGRPFIRNICTALDSRLWRHKPETRLFSQSI